MIENGKRLDLTVEEGNTLVGISSIFHLPEKLDKENFSVSDRSMAGDEVRLLFRELRAYSPMMQADDMLNRFGPLEAWKDVRDDVGRTGKKIIKRSLVVSVRVDADILSGILWCLLVAVHPSSSLLQPTQVQEDAIWPIAKKISRTRVLREMIGLSTTTQPRRWKTDEEYEQSEK